MITGEIRVTHMTRNAAPRHEMLRGEDGDTPVFASLMQGQPRSPAPALAQGSPEVFAKEAIIAWFRGEFAAANAIIDALCSHLSQLTAVPGRGSEYAAVFAAVHRRRMNWIPILQMQEYCSIADVTLELQRVASIKASSSERTEEKKGGGGGVVEHDARTAPDESEEGGREEESGESPAAEKKSTVAEDESGGDDPPESRIAHLGSQSQPTSENIQICSNHEDCAARPTQIKLRKGFVAKESAKGHVVNVLKGLKLFEDIFTESELSKVTDFVNELRVAGQNGKLSGETFILFNKQMKNRRELIQLGIPIFGPIRDDGTSAYQSNNLEPIPALLQNLIDHLIMWQLIPDYKRPNSCIINFFDEGEYSQPFLKPPHLEQPIVTLLLSGSAMAFGRTLTSDSERNFKGPLMLSLKEGSLLVMRGNSADMARHVMCSSPTKRISITFFRVKFETNQNQPSIPPLTAAMTPWEPNFSTPYMMSSIPKWGTLRAPAVMVGPTCPMVLNLRRIPNGGTGVFLPWTVGPSKPVKHLPPRAQKARFLTFPSPVETHGPEPISDSSITV